MLEKFGHDFSSLKGLAKFFVKSVLCEGVISAGKNYTWNDERCRFFNQIL